MIMLQENKVDIVFINPGDRKQIYQNLGQDIAAVEPPFWIAALAAYLRNNGATVAVIDANAENISPEETAVKVKALKPLVAAVIVYGSQPSASTQNMTIAGKICEAIKAVGIKVAIGGLHPTALPRLTMEQSVADFLIEGEGPYTLKALLQALKGSGGFVSVPGLWYRNGGDIKNNERAPLMADLDACLPVGAWDLLPMEKYRAHNWHCFGHINERMPYGVIYTSLGCPFNCVFCCINALFGKPGIRYRSPKLVVDEIELLVKKYGVKNIKVADELFVLDEKHYMTIAEMIIARGLKVNIWAYARVDTVKQQNLKRMKEAGINWLALGIESANSKVRDGASKQMRVTDIKKVVQEIQAAGIYVIGNYIFGLPDDDVETMQETLDMALDLNCEFGNFYYAMAYPGSKLYNIAIQEKWTLPDTWHGFSQHSYNARPLPTKHIGAREVLGFRDEAFHKYYSHGPYLDSIEKKFGSEVRKHIETMAKTRLKRELLEK